MIKKKVEKARELSEDMRVKDINNYINAAKQCNCISAAAWWSFVLKIKKGYSADSDTSD